MPDFLNSSELPVQIFLYQLSFRKLDKYKFVFVVFFFIIIIPQSTVNKYRP